MGLSWIVGAGHNRCWRGCLVPCAAGAVTSASGSACSPSSPLPPQGSRTKTSRSACPPRWLFVGAAAPAGPASSCTPWVHRSVTRPHLRPSPAPPPHLSPSPPAPPSPLLPLPPQRVDRFDDDIANIVTNSAKRSGLTFAPEAGTQARPSRIAFVLRPLRSSAPVLQL